MGNHCHWFIETPEANAGLRAARQLPPELVRLLEDL